MIDPSREAQAACRRLNYYATGVLRELAPRSLFRFDREAAFRALKDSGALTPLLSRVNHYNRLEAGLASAAQTRIDAVDRSKSRYFIDISEHLKYFPADLRIDYLFGDIVHVPPVPTLLKSRPVGADNANSVLLNLDKLRHFRRFDDQVPFEKKTPRAVWRGTMNNPLRKALVVNHAASPFCDVGHVSKAFEEIPPSNVLLPTQQFAYRYIISVEGYDVATNLKWVMASNSVCLMPKPRFETWFMESTLIANRHYVELRDDFSDLEEKIKGLEAEPDRARQIVANANRHVAMFFDRRNEKLASLLVLQKYFEATGQLPPSAFSDAFFGKARPDARALDMA
jgi:hypothetical protein